MLVETAAKSYPLGVNASARTAAPLGKGERYYTTPLNHYRVCLLVFKENYFITFWIFLSLFLCIEVLCTQAQLSCCHFNLCLHLLLICFKCFP